MPFVSVFPTKGLQYTKLSPVLILIHFIFLKLYLCQQGDGYSSVGSAATFIVSTLILKVPSSEFVFLSRIFISGKELTVFTLCDDKARVTLERGEFELTSPRRQSHI